MDVVNVVALHTPYFTPSHLGARRSRVASPASPALIVLLFVVNLSIIKNHQSDDRHTRECEC